MWEEPKKMDDPTVMREALALSGIDADRIVARSQDADVKNRLMALTQDAVDRGAFGSPTFFVNDEMFFGKDQLRDVEEEILAQRGAAENSVPLSNRRVS
jgi:2-hydroxychromene-2-carboxylate isomerase